MYLHAKTLLPLPGLLVLQELSALCPLHLPRAKHPSKIRQRHPMQLSSENGDFNGDVSNRSIGDYVGGLHGGKYNFDSRISGVTSLNYENSVVFGDATTDDTGRVLAPIPGHEDDPAWSNRSVDLESISADRNVRVGESFILSNEEISWEPFYIRVEMDGGTSATVLPFKVSPSSGLLAPRGGSGRFTDQCTISIDSSSDGSSEQQESFYVVVRFETSAMAYRVVA